jgi:hypothetical protein
MRAVFFEYGDIPLVILSALCKLADVLKPGTGMMRACLIFPVGVTLNNNKKFSLALFIYLKIIIFSSAATANKTPFR